MKTGRDILKGSLLPFDTETANAAVSAFFAYEKPKQHSFSPDGRRINHFCLGADPEFMFINRIEPVPAINLGLKAGLAFGADQNERLVELRAAPSRSAVVVLGSILAELRWLYRYSKNPYTWQAHAFMHGDGMGGHVHFGRKRPQQADEVAGLDGLARTLRAADLLDSFGWTRRSKGDQYHQVYGQYGDIRPQKHGYEYRTLPTWLDSPKLAYLVLVLSKLVVVDPDITAGWTTGLVPPWQLLQGLAKYYKGRDDDALLLYSMMEDPAKFAFSGGDFRLRWGLFGQTEALAESLVIPPVIEPSPETLQDLTGHLAEDKPLVMREEQPNFRAQIPSDYHWVPPVINYHRRPNVGDLFYDMVQHNEIVYTWDFDRIIGQGCQIVVPSTFNISALLKIAGDIRVLPGNSLFAFRVSPEWRKGVLLQHLRQVLYSGLLPLWKVDEVQTDSYRQWQERNPPKARRRKAKYSAIIRGL